MIYCFSMFIKHIKKYLTIEASSTKCEQKNGLNLSVPMMLVLKTRGMNDHIFFQILNNDDREKLITVNNQIALKSYMENSKTYITKLNKDLELNKQKVQSLQNEIDEQIDFLYEDEQDEIEMKQELEYMTNEIERLKGTIAMQEEEIDKLITKLKWTESREKLHEQALYVEKETYNALREVTVNMKKYIDTKKEEISQMQKEKELYEHEIKDLKDEIKDLKEKIKQLECNK